MEEEHFVIVGLGNPGKQYAQTRHNMGYMVVQAFAASRGWKFKEERRFSALVIKDKVGDAVMHLVLPTTYMNESGYAVRRYLDFYKLGIRNLLVVSDDIALPFGKLRLRSQGSPGGHNGLKSVEAHLRTKNYARLKMGIGQGHTQEDLVDHVLDRFTRNETELLTDFIAQGVDIVKSLPTESFANLMTRVNQN